MLDFKIDVRWEDSLWTRWKLRVASVPERPYSLGGPGGTALPRVTDRLRGLLALSIKSRNSPRRLNRVRYVPVRRKRSPNTLYIG